MASRSRCVPISNTYRCVTRETLVALVPSDHRLTAKKVVQPKDLLGEPYIAMANRATVLRATIDAYLEQRGVDLKPTHFVNNPAMVMLLVASARGVTIISCLRAEFDAVVGGESPAGR